MTHLRFLIKYAKFDSTRCCLIYCVPPQWIKDCTAILFRSDICLMWVQKLATQMEGNGHHKRNGNGKLNVNIEFYYYYIHTQKKNIAVFIGFY